MRIPPLKEYANGNVLVSQVTLLWNRKAQPRMHRAVLICSEDSPDDFRMTSEGSLNVSSCNREFLAGKAVQTARFNAIVTQMSPQHTIFRNTKASNIPTTPITPMSPFRHNDPPKVTGALRTYFCSEFCRKIDILMRRTSIFSF